jgi:SNF family Na+-dependent transporter
VLPRLFIFFLSKKRFAGIVVFSIIGFKAHSTYDACVERNDTKNEVCDLQKELSNSASGTGLAFIIFTEAINQFPGAQLWAVLFFLMLFTLGIDSQFGTLEGVISSLIDMKLFPHFTKERVTMVMTHVRSKNKFKLTKLFSPFRCYVACAAFYRWCLPTEQEVTYFS